MKKRIIILVILFLGIVLVSGCTSPQSPAPVTPVTVQPTSPPEVVPVITSPPVTASPVVTFRPESQYPSYGVVTEQTTRIQVDNPYQEYLNVRKKTFDYSIPNCPMQVAFPEITTDPSYGIQQPVPKLTALTQDQYDEFLWKYTEGKAENTPIKTLPECRGAPGNPEWNFVEIRTILNPTNVRPASYTISQNIRSKGEIITRFTTTRTLVIDEKVVLTSYVPIKTSELELFELVDLTYTRQ